MRRWSVQRLALDVRRRSRRRRGLAMSRLGQMIRWNALIYVRFRNLRRRGTRFGCGL